MAIHINHVVKAFGGKKILADFSICFENSKIIFLNGRSGIGKTTILNLIMGIYMPDYGTIDGVKGKRISCVFQDKRLLLSETAEKNIACVIGKNPQIEKFSMREIWKSISDDYKKSQAKKWLKLMGLNEYCDQKVENLSGGMQQLVSIARALASPKDILLLDEPFVGLDLTLKRKIVKLIKENAKNIITIIVTHDVYHGKLLSDQMYLLSGPPVFAKQVYL